jgi:hypothetical protein
VTRPGCYRAVTHELLFTTRVRAIHHKDCGAGRLCPAVLTSPSIPLSTCLMGLFIIVPILVCQTHKHATREDYAHHFLCRCALNRLFLFNDALYAYTGTLHKDGLGSSLNRLETVFGSCGWSICFNPPNTPRRDMHDINSRCQSNLKSAPISPSCLQDDQAEITTRTRRGLPFSTDLP